MRNWFNDLWKLYFDRRMITVLILGFQSGLPLLLTASTLSIWLAEVGIGKAQIGIFSLVGLPYACKFFWAPFFDHAKIPLFTAWFGRRRGAIIFLQMLLLISLVALGLCDPREHLARTACCAFVVAFLSASLDIVIDAFRVEILDEKSYGAGAATVVFGYRIGMLIAGAGALYLATVMSWAGVYFSMAVLMFLGLGAVFLAQEPKQHDNGTPFLGIRKGIIEPLLGFFKQSGWLILLLIATYKLGDSFFTGMVNVFVLETGFSKIEIAGIQKVWGFIATMLGGFIAGIMTARMNLMRAMLLCGLIHVVLNLVFVLQAYIGYNPYLLVIAIGIEYLTSGMTTVALVAFISNQCQIRNTAAQYALFSSFAAIPRTVLSSSCGYYAELMGWPMYFIFTSAIGLPSLFLIHWLMKRDQKSPTERNVITAYPFFPLDQGYADDFSLSNPKKKIKNKK